MRVAPRKLGEVLRAALLVALAAVVVWLALAWLRVGERVRPPRFGPPVPRCPVRSFPRLDRPVSFTVDFYGLRYEGRSDNWVDASILYLGAYEKHELYFMRDLVRALAPAGGVFVDVGANTGQHSMFMSRHVAQVHAFEPFEKVLRRFRAMVQQNRLANITIHPVGLGDKETKLLFHEPPAANLGTGSFVPGHSSANRPATAMQVVVGDRALAAAGGQRVGLIKIDVEGFERPVLRGLRRTLEASRPVVVMEVTADPDNKVAFRSARQLMEALPRRYERLTFDARSDEASGRYLLTGRELVFGKGRRYDVVLFPAEKSRQVPRRGPVNAR